MDRAAALKFAEEMQDNLSYRLECAEKVPARSYYEKQSDMLRYAIAAMREQEHNNEPLTQEELRGMVGEWVWVVVDYQHGDQRYQCNGWALVALPTFVAYLDQTLPIDFYGKKFLAYRHKLEAADHE